MTTTKDDDQFTDQFIHTFMPPYMRTSLSASYVRGLPELPELPQLPLEHKPQVTKTTEAYKDVPSAHPNAGMKTGWRRCSKLTDFLFGLHTRPRFAKPRYSLGP